MAYRRGLTNTRRKRFVARGVKSRRRLALSRRSRRYRSYRPSRRTLIRSGFPKRLTVKLAYVDSININPPQGPDGFGTYVFRANSVYDPDFTGTGHQPMMFDTYMALYDHYQVKWSSIKVINTPTFSGTQTHPPIWGVYLSDAASGVSAMQNVNQLLEQRDHGPFKMAGLRDNSSNLRMQTIKRSVNIRKFVGTRDHSLLRGDAGSNPSEDVYFIIWVSARAMPFDPTAEQFDVHMNFIVEFTEPRIMPQS